MRHGLIPGFSMSAPVTVIKLGGSLLTLPDLATRLNALLIERIDCRPLLIVGGGAMVDGIRQLGERFDLSEKVCHDLAMKALDLTAESVAEIFGNAAVVDHPGEAEIQWRIGRLPMLRLRTWFERSESLGETLPQTWDTTSDSLAALVARTWPADELWLLKSTDLPDCISIQAASDAGLVDQSFPIAAQGVPRGRWCNLRANQPELRRWW